MEFRECEQESDVCTGIVVFQGAAEAAVVGEVLFGDGDAGEFRIGAGEHECIALPGVFYDFVILLVGGDIAGFRHEKILVFGGGHRHLVRWEQANLPDTV